jgi:cytochrome c peroxidase
VAVNRAFVLGVILAIVLCGCGEKSASDPARVAPAAARRGIADKSFYANDFSKIPSVAAMTRLGRELFFDPRLSASGRFACATCHDPRFAYGPGPSSPKLGAAGAVDSGGAVRAIPSLRYMQDIPPFSEHHFDEAVDESVDQGPTGGHMWDGRADSLHDQARLPLFSPREMANTRAEDIVAKVAASDYAGCFRETFGADVFNDPQRAFRGVLQALEVFQQSPEDFYPYSSKYDAWLRGRATLSAREGRGLEVFNDPAKGNCASCHPSQIRGGAFPQFTDYGYISLGVPRNRAIAANRDPAYFDLGLCGPERADLRGRFGYCGRFRAPTLRNVALRHSFFHNGVFPDLRRAVEFYARRDTVPADFYGRDAKGAVRKFDDLPEAFRANVNMEPPFGGREPLSQLDIDDLLAFLSTLTDGFDGAQEPVVGKSRDPRACRRSGPGCASVRRVSLVIFAMTGTFGAS